MLVFASCSPGMFSSGTDTKISEQPRYRLAHAACSGLKITRPDIDPETARQLVRCLNSNHTLDAYERLVGQLKDNELQPILDLANRYVLSDPARLYELLTTFRTLKSQSAIDRVMRQFGILISNEEFVSSSLGMLKEVYLVEGSRWSGRRADPTLLKALERLSRKVTPPQMLDLIEGSLSVAESRASVSLQKKLSAEISGARAFDMLWAQALHALAVGTQADQRTYPRRLAQPPRLTSRRESALQPMRELCTNINHELRFACARLRRTRPELGPPI